MSYNSPDSFINKSLKYGEKYNLKRNKNTLGWNDEIDSFRHCFLQATYNIYYGENISKFIGDFYEDFVGFIHKQSDLERYMDLWNNRQGRIIADEIKQEYGNKFYKLSEEKQDDIIAEKIMKKMRKGELITNPNDIKSKNITGFASDISEYNLHKEESDKIISDLLENYSKALMKNNFSKMYTNENGHWVTIDGNYVFIED